MKRILVLGALLIVISAVALPRQAISQIPGNVKIVHGECSSESHVAQGPIGADLTHLRSRFFCDTMVVNFFEQPGHVLIQFSLGKSETAQILGFGGQMIDNKRIAVERAYFQPMKPINVDDGICIFSFKGHHLDNVFCGAKVDANGYRTVAVVKFTASPGQ